MSDFVYRGENAREISFPLGGIGAGCVGLAGNGQLIDVEIFGKPNKGSHAALSHFAIKAENGSRVLDARVCQGPYLGSRSGNFNRPHFNSYGFGVDRSSMMGLPHFRDCEFEGRFPVAELRLSDDRFPGLVRLRAFNPFIPLKDLDSSLPAAFFHFYVTNPTDEPLRYSLCFSLNNLLTKTGGLHSYHETPTGRAILLKCEQDEEAGLCLATDCMSGSHQLYWYRGDWFDNLNTFWQDFTAFGPLKDRRYHSAKTGGDPNYSADDLASLCASLEVPAGETGELRFVWSWYIPEENNYWNPPEDCGCGCDHGQEDGDCGCGHDHGQEDGGCGCGAPANNWRQYYATRFTGALDVAAYCIKNFRSLEEETCAFTETLFSSKLPKEALEAVSANLAVIKSPTCLRLEDGSLYGFEGCHCDSGCCEGSCTHVWSYTYAIPFLFPALERSMRQNEYLYSCHDSGAMGFRLMLPLGRPATDFRPCADGQFATVMRVYREFRISGKLEWLRSLWPQVKKTIEYAWSEENYDRWDADKDGILEGRQHHTLDMELFGPNAWLSGLYLGALQAGARMAELLGDEAAAAEYGALYRRGRRKLNQELFNGEYFIQRIDLRDKALLESYTQGKALTGGSAVDAYWNEERGEIKYQIGEGCGIDQLLGQWHADLIGLGSIFDEDKTASALRSIYRYNFMEHAGDFMNPCRLYCLDEESGLRICVWPEGRRRPFIGAPYSEETMHGFEYAAASMMIRHGMEEEGLRCVKAVRDRYDGRYRNPWNEFECGSNYARSMASFALLLVYSGLKYDLYEQRLGFAPLHPKDFACLWSLEGAWGQVRYGEGNVSIRLMDGALRLKRLDLNLEGRRPKTLLVDGQSLAFRAEEGALLCSEAFTAKREIRVLFE